MDSHYPRTLIHTHTQNMQKRIFCLYAHAYPHIHKLFFTHALRKAYSSLRMRIFVSYLPVTVAKPAAAAVKEPGWEELVIVPRVGTCVLFTHDVQHEGRKVTEGHKFILR